MSEEKKLFSVSTEVYNKLPGFILISGLIEVGTVNEPAIKDYLKQSWEGLKQKIANADSVENKRIQSWNETLKAAGVKIKDFPPSIQSISKRASKGGEVFSVNPIVDAYNAISMELALPFGAYDVTELGENLQFRLSAGGEEFIAIGTSENEPTLPGEIVLCDDKGVLTRMFIWRQSGRSKITTASKKFAFVCELLNTMDPGLQEKAKELIIQKMEALIGAKFSEVSIQQMV